jgi:hypothetical protein
MACIDKEIDLKMIRQVASMSDAANHLSEILEISEPLGSNVLLVESGALAISDVVYHLHQDGVCRPNITLTNKQTKQCLDAVEQHFNNVMHTLTQLDLLENLEVNGFTEFKLRGRGRYDFQVPAFRSPLFDFLHDGAPWMPAVKAILGEDCDHIIAGCMMSFPDCAMQEWHSDGDHQSQHAHLPTYGVNVFIPLVDINPVNGPTQ